VPLLVLQLPDAIVVEGSVTAPEKYTFATLDGKLVSRAALTAGSCAEPLSCTRLLAAVPTAYEVVHALPVELATPAPG